MLYQFPNIYPVFLSIDINVKTAVVSLIGGFNLMTIKHILIDFPGDLGFTHANFCSTPSRQQDNLCKCSDEEQFKL